MDFRRCLEIQMPYLGPVVGVYTIGRRSGIASRCSPRRWTAATLAIREYHRQVTVTVHDSARRMGALRQSAARQMWPVFRRRARSSLLNDDHCRKRNRS